MSEKPSKNEWPEWSLIRFVAGDAEDIQSAINKWKERHEHDKALMTELLEALKAWVADPGHGWSSETMRAAKAAIAKAEGNE